MHKQILFNIIFIFCTVTSLAQNNKIQKFNFNFEEAKTSIPSSQNWFVWGSYNVQRDSSMVFTGKYSVKVEDSGDNDSFGCVAFAIPNKYKGKEIKLEGYMKTLDVENGFAGLMLRLDKDKETIGFDNMQNQNINGSNEWKKYSITLPLPDDVDMIYIAGILSGEGKAWFDDFRLTIDGKDFETLELSERVLAKAEMDKEFDTGSNFTLTNPTPTQINNLYQLGKKWGYLKYHHPMIAKGKYNWDYELFRVLPSVNVLLPIL